MTGICGHSCDNEGSCCGDNAANTLRMAEYKMKESVFLKTLSGSSGNLSVAVPVLDFLLYEIITYFLRFYLFVYLFIFLERGGGKEKEKERNIFVWLPLKRPLLGAWPAT